MAAQDFHHGARVIEVSDGSNSLRTIATAVIGLVATADDADPDYFPLDKPVLVTNIAQALTKAGKAGTLKKALTAISLQVDPVLVIVRVAEGVGDTPEEKEADQTSKVVGSSVEGARTGIQALESAESIVKVRPRILGAPGLDTKPVADALASTGKKLRAMSYAYAWGCKTKTEAMAYRNQFGQRETCMIWPNPIEWDTETSKAVVGYSIAYAMGMRAQTDATQGWVKTISNVPINGILGLEYDVSWNLQDDANDAAVLNREDITTLIMEQGARFWGNRTCSDDEDFTFESTVRTSQVLADTIAEAHFPYIDKPMRPYMVKTILDNIEAKGRSLVASGDLLGFGAWIDEKINTKQSLKVGKLTIHYNFTDVPPLEDLTFMQVKTDVYFSEFFTSSKLGN